MKSYPVLIVIFAMALAGCGETSSENKNGGSPQVTTTTMTYDETEQRIATNTQVCGDSSRPFNASGSFEIAKEGGSEPNLMRLFDRFRFQDDGVGSGILIFEVACATGSASGSQKGQVRYRRSGNTIEFLEDLRVVATGNAALQSCTYDFHIKKSTVITLGTMYSCLLIGPEGATDQGSLVAIPYPRGI